MEFFNDVKPGGLLQRYSAVQIVDRALKHFSCMARPGPFAVYRTLFILVGPARA